VKISLTFNMMKDLIWFTFFLMVIHVIQTTESGFTTLTKLYKL